MRRTRSPHLRGDANLRLRISFLVIAVVLSVFAGRLVQLQGLDPHSYAAMAAAEGTVTATMPATRGEILDRNGVPLADSVEGLMVVADPQLTAPNAAALATILSRRLDLDYFETLRRLQAQDSRFQYVARQVPADLASSVVDDLTREGYLGLATRDDPLRSYPGKDVAANVVGVLGSPRRNGAARPRSGFEVVFNKLLAGQDGSARYEVGGGNKIPLGESTVVPPVDGQDITTTIDSELQWYVQRVLRDTVIGADGASGLAVMMDTDTGEVLALADYPSFDASRPEVYGLDDFGAKSVNEFYEPGSVEKVLTAASLIDAGKVTMGTRFSVPGVLERDGTVIHDYFEHDTLRLTLAGIIAKSSNIGTVLAAQRLGRGQLRSYLEDFGLGARTTTGLLGETAGLLPPKDAWTRAARDRIAFGQSLSVGPLQMTAAVNAIANGGVRVDPSIVEGSERTRSGALVGTDTATSRRVVSEEAARQTLLMMQRVVDPEAGVAPGAAIPGYTVAGKTGTAQRVDPECGCYQGTTVSFVGTAPADDPRFTLYVAVQQPRDGSGGGSVAGPAFASIMGFALRHFQVPPTGARPSRIPVEWEPAASGARR